jgi:hypothetical protein
MKTVTTGSEIEGFELYELTIRTPRTYNYDEKDGSPFLVEAMFHQSGESGLSECKIKLDGELSKNIVRALAPILAQSAANAAQKLADNAKTLANSLSNVMLKQLEPKTEAEGA